MNAPSATEKFDDGLYHPFVATPVMLIPTTIATSPMDSSNSDTPDEDSQPIAIKSGSPVTHSISKSPYKSIPTDTFTSTAALSSPTSSAYSPMSTLATSPIQVAHDGKPSNHHNSVRDGLTALAVSLIILGLVAFTGFLTSQRFRSWRERRSARRLESRWEISRPYYKEDSFIPAMRQAPPTDSTPILIYGQIDPFARSIPRQSRMCKDLRFSEPEGLDDFKEVLLYDDEVCSEELAERPAGPRQNPSRGGIPSNGVSYLLTRLKESISGRSRFSTLGSRNGDLGRGRWNEVGQIVMEDEKDHEIYEDEEKSAGLYDQHQQAHFSVRREFSLVDIALPELPPLACDMNSTLKMTTMKRSRNPSMDVEIASPARGDLSSSRSRRQRVENILSSGNYTHLPTPSSRSRRQRKESRHVYPGGFIGRSPTKKLRRKACPEC